MLALPCRLVLLLIVGLAAAAASAAETKSGKGRDRQSVILTREYVHAIQGAVSRNWVAPDAEPVQCTVEVTQLPGGEVVGATATDACDATEPVRQSLLAAIHRANPLPYAGYESVFRRKLILTFRRNLDP